MFDDYYVCSEAWKNYIIQLDTLREEFKKHKELIHRQFTLNNFLTQRRARNDAVDAEQFMSLFWNEKKLQNRWRILCLRDRGAREQSGLRLRSRIINFPRVRALNNLPP